MSAKHEHIAGKEMRMEREPLEIAAQAYLDLLKMPFGNDRIAAQPLLSALRDFIADRTGCNSEDVQNDFESHIA